MCPTPSACGSVTFEQRFGSDPRVNLHFRVLALDGVYSGADGEEPELQLEFAAASAAGPIAQGKRRGT